MSEMPMLDLLGNPNAWAALVTLSALEIVLGIDNVIFISILAARLDPAAGRTARRFGLLLALIFRVALIADGFDVHIPRGYIYFAMAFAAAVEAVNMVVRQRHAEREKR